MRHALRQVLPGQCLRLDPLWFQNLDPQRGFRASGGRLFLQDDAVVWQAPVTPGVYTLSAAMRGDRGLVWQKQHLIVPIPPDRVQNGMLGGYPIGHYVPVAQRPRAWLANRGIRDTAQPIAGFIEVNSQTSSLQISRHYTLGDFAGKDEAVGGRRYLVLEPRLVEKLEAVIDLLKARGYACGKLPLMSAYRSPRLNAAIGNQTTFSRHTCGDAADIIVPDLDRNGRCDRKDAEALLSAITTLDRTTHLAGGASLYAPTSAHGYFVHTDTRGALTRW